MSTAFTPTHVVPAGGLDAWARPDGTTTALARLDPGLEVQVLDTSGDWARIRCSNDWEAWADGRRLVPRPPPAAPPAGPGGEGPPHQQGSRPEVPPDGRRDDDLAGELLSSLQTITGAYRELMDAFAAGHIDETTMRREALRIGLLVKDDEAWILDVVNGQWLRFDGFEVRRIDLGIGG